MSAWRRKAVSLFPELKADSEDWSSPYQLFFDLLSFTQDSHRLRNNQALYRAYGSAEWCLHQESKEFWNAAGLCFYESLFDEQDQWEDVIPWLSPYVVAECSCLWETRLGAEKFEVLKQKLSSGKISNRNSFRSGEIEAL
jgi:hypothetical protein